MNVSLWFGADYAITDRLVVSGSVPLVFGRYTDPNTPPPPIPFFPVDECRCWNYGWQDVHVEAHYNAFTSRGGVFAVTPLVSIGTPSHDYPYQGESVLGRNLRELYFGADAGARIDSISPNLSLQGHYAYAVVEDVLDVPNNRSNATLDVAYRLSRRLAVRGLTRWQRTHGGLRGGSPTMPDLPRPGDVNTPERVDEHDRLLRDNSFHLGGAVSYQFTRFDVFGSFVQFVTGSDTHRGHAVTVGVSVPFDLSRQRKP